MTIHCVLKFAEELLLEFQTLNGGLSWNELQLPAQGTDSRTWHTVLAVDPIDFNRIYANGQFLEYPEGAPN